MEAMSGQRPDRRRVGARALAAAGLAALLVGAGLAVAPAFDDGSREGAATAVTTAPPLRPSPPPKAVVVRVPLRAVGALDPEGDGQENDEQAGLAVDGSAATAWTTERYQTFAKRGVGLVLDAGRPRRLQRLDVGSGTPGVAAEIRVGATAQGPFRPVGGVQSLGETTRFRLGGARGRYVVVWITAIPGGGAAEIAEVTLRARR
jgi:hypothetical protein